MTNTHRCQHTHAHGTTLVSGENVKMVCQWCWRGWHILHRVQYTLCLGDKRVAAEHQNGHYLSPARWICWASSDWINAKRNNYYQARFQVSVTLVTLKKKKKKIKNRVGASDKWCLIFCRLAFSLLTHSYNYKMILTCEAKESMAADPRLTGKWRWVSGLCGPTDAVT